MKWLCESNRWKHLVGGLIIGTGANSIYCAAYSGIGVASALELKDHLWGNKWDWIDWLVTICGVSVGFMIRLLIINLLE